MRLRQGNGKSTTTNLNKSQAARSNPHTKKTVTKTNTQEKAMKYSFNLNMDGMFAIRKTFGPVALAVACSASMGGVGPHNAHSYMSL
jgi:hypothetical protein